MQEKVRQLTGIMPSKSINPDECVAQGAAIQGDTLNEHTTLTNSTGLLLLDVTPLSLAIETVGGVATRVVERNSTLPVHYQQVFTTAGMFQSSVEINVLQGERPMARDNKSIGKFRLKGIRRAMAGVPKIEVTFDIDTNGILTVSARDQDTGRAQSITITADNKMSEDEIQQAIRDAEQYAAQDAFRRDLMDTINQAQHLLAQVSAALNQCSKQLDKDEKKRVKDDEAALRHLIGRAKPDKNDGGLPVRHQERHGSPRKQQRPPDEPLRPERTERRAVMTKSQKPHHVRRVLLIALTVVAALVTGCTVYLTSKLCRGGADRTDRHGDFADAAGQSGITSKGIASTISDTIPFFDAIISEQKQNPLRRQHRRTRRKCHRQQALPLPCEEHRYHQTNRRRAHIPRGIQYIRESSLPPAPRTAHSAGTT